MAGRKYKRDKQGRFAGGGGFGTGMSGTIGRGAKRAGKIAIRNAAPLAAVGVGLAVNSSARKMLR